MTSSYRSHSIRTLLRCTKQKYAIYSVVVLELLTCWPIPKSCGSNAEIPFLIELTNMVIISINLPLSLLGYAPVTILPSFLNSS
ncbi:hypothetical protein HDV62DRAFT_207564 [Trichoderma sp. SZMC 28011]